MHDAVGTELSRRAKVERLANRSQKLRCDAGAEVLGKFFGLILGVRGDAISGEQPRHDLDGPLLALPPRPGVPLLHRGGLILRFEAGGSFWQRFDQYGPQDVEPRLHLLGLEGGTGILRRRLATPAGTAGTTGTTIVPADTRRQVELRRTPKYLEDLLEHHGRLEAVLVGVAEALSEGQQQGEALQHNVVERPALLLGLVLVPLADLAQG
mmetsp:Transcript_18745/g.53924  ORF Transcript_18745/g.53924 Transcript_18745/m.53924 type:complete len:210 (+) Transcript_18745:2189-2818(+)